MKAKRIEEPTVADRFVSRTLTILAGIVFGSGVASSIDCAGVGVAAIEPSVVVEGAAVEPPDVGVELDPPD